jgi:hypothetical protein
MLNMRWAGKPCFSDSASWKFKVMFTFSWFQLLARESEVLYDLGRGKERACPCDGDGSGLVKHFPSFHVGQIDFLFHFLHKVDEL